MRKITARKFVASLALLTCGISISVLAESRSSAQAQFRGGLYNMQSLLNQRHPFAARVTPNAQSTAGSTRVTSASAFPRQAAARAIPAKVLDNGGSSKAPNLLSEIRVGELVHDTGPFSSQDESGIDTNFELLFASPDIFSFMWSPRPHLGISYNSSGDTSQAYFGLTWDWSFLDNWFFEVGLGGMIHDGHLVGVDDQSKSLGCRLLFRESINVGYRFYKRHSLMLHFDHSSNASLCKKNTADGSAEGRHDVVLNEGLENLGIRYGYMF